MKLCPDCGRAGVAGVARRIVLPGDRRSDEIALEILACGCGFKAVGVAEAARRARLRGGDAERVCYRLPAAAVDLIAFLIARCPDPAEEYCDCPAHATLNRRDLRNQWNLLHSFAPFPGFEIGAASAPLGTSFAYAPLAWTRNGDGYRAAIDGREWRLEPLPPGASRYELSVGDALGLELDAWPPFWVVEEGEEGGGEPGRSKEGQPPRHEGTKAPRK